KADDPHGVGHPVEADVHEPLVPVGLVVGQGLPIQIKRRAAEASIPAEVGRQGHGAMLAMAVSASGTGGEYHAGMDSHAAKLLEELQAFIAKYPRQGRTYGQFWEEFHAHARQIQGLVNTAEADPEVVARYVDLLDGAHDAFGCPPGHE